MRRKAIQLANKTIVVSLPAKWVKQQGIKKGDEIEVEEGDSRLFLSTESKPSEIKKTINIDEYGPMKNRIVLSNYLQGVDELELIFNKTEEIKEIKERVVNELIGFEIIKQTANSLILKDISGFSEQDLNRIISRIFLIIESTSKELLEALENKQEDLNHIISIDKETNRMAYYSIRILNKREHEEIKKLPILYSTILLLEKIGDLYRDLARYIMGNNIKLSKEDLENLKLISELFLIIKKLYFNFKKEDLVNLYSSYENIKKRIFSNLEKRKSDARLYMYYSHLILEIVSINNDILLTV